MLLRRLFPLLFLVLLLPVVVVASHVLSGPSVASAEVEHGVGFVAVVDGFRSWFGSYRLAGLGTVWCVDHGIPAPDAALGYVPVALPGDGAVAWAVGRYGGGVDDDRVGAAALMLALHDLMGAVYPSGRLSVDGLSPDRLAGFEGLESAVLDRARAIRADAVAHAGLVAPVAIDVGLDAPSPPFAGRGGTLTARVRDAAGAGVGGVVVHPSVTAAALLTDVDVVTDADGTARWSFEAGPGSNRFELSADVPSLAAEAFAPTGAVAQRVVRPARLVVSGGAAFDAAIPHRLTIAKHGDAEPRLPVSGARFRITPLAAAPADEGTPEADDVGEVVTSGPDGRTPPVEVAPGTYVVTEVEPPPGYGAAGPWTVEVGEADVTLDVTDTALRGRLHIDKVDAVTGAAVDGARFEVTDDRGGVADPAAPLLRGRYTVREVEPPPGYRLAPDPVTADVVAGEEAVVRIADQPLASIAFEKHPPLAGARFSVEPSDHQPPEATVSCTTGADGRCSLPPLSLDAGRRYCWHEAEAPPGWLPATGGCVDLGGAGTVTTVVVDEQALPPPSPPASPPVADVVLGAASTPPPLPPPPPPPPPLPPPGRPPELPLTGASTTKALASVGSALVGVGLLLLSPRSRRSRPHPRRRFRTVVCPGGGTTVR